MGYIGGIIHRSQRLILTSWDIQVELHIHKSRMEPKVMEVDGSDDFLFTLDDLFRFQPLNFPGVSKNEFST